MNNIQLMQPNDNMISRYNFLHARVGRTCSWHPNQVRVTEMRLNQQSLIYKFITSKSPQINFSPSIDEALVIIHNLLMKYYIKGFKTMREAKKSSGKCVKWPPYFVSAHRWYGPYGIHKKLQKCLLGHKSEFSRTSLKIT